MHHQDKYHQSNRIIIKETLDIQELAIIVMHSKGYNLIIDESEDSNCTQYIARRNESSFYAHSWISLLGLISIWENLGDNLLDRVKEGEQLRLTVVNHQITS